MSVPPWSRLVPLWLAALLLGCAPDARTLPAVADGPVAAAWRADSERVVFGAPFELVVECAWDRELDPPTWPPRGFEPLTVLERARERRAVDGRTVETRWYEARALSAGALVIDGLEFFMVEGEQRRAARTTPLELDVVSSLAALDDGAPELALLVLGPAPTVWPWMLALAGAATIGVLTFARRRAVPVDEAAGVRPTTIESVGVDDLSATLDGLGTPSSLNNNERDWYRDLNNVVRVALGRRLGLDLSSLTGSDLLRITPRGVDLRAFVARADRARFAQARIEASLRAADLATARALVHAHAARGGRE